MKTMNRKRYSFRLRLLCWGMIVSLGLMLCATHLPSQVDAAGGPLDYTFGISGKVSSDFLNVDNEAYNVAIQPDGKIVVVGSAECNQQGLGNDFAVARYNADGSPDFTFGNGGKVTTGFINASSRAEAVVVDNAGRILVVGLAFHAGIGGNVAVARYNSSGMLDPFYGNGGKAEFMLPNPSSPRDAVLLPSGQLAIAAVSYDGNTNNFTLMLVSKSGKLDSLTSTDFAGDDSYAEAMALTADGKIVIVGSIYAGGTYDCGVARYNADGTIDSNFGNGGKASFDLASGDADYANAVAIQPDGKIVVGGSVSLSPLSNFMIMRLNPNGSLDNNFGTGGKTVSAYQDAGTEIYDLVIQPDGAIIAGGSHYDAEETNVYYDFLLTRYDANGFTDPGFGLGGWVRTDFLGAEDELRALALQSDGKIVAVGKTYPAPGTINFGVARYRISSPSYDYCIQDNIKQTILKFNSTTGEYEFSDCASSMWNAGIGTVSKADSNSDCLIKLTANSAEGSLTASINTCMKSGNANIKVLLWDGQTFKIYKLADSDITNNNGSCF
jgi:uncharacterized delta-60 repeat protein